MNTKLLSRMEQLISEIPTIEKTKNHTHNGVTFDYEHLDNDIYEQWSLKLQNIINLTAGEQSHYMKKYIKTTSNNNIYYTNLDEFKDNIPILKALKDDYENGFITSIEALVHADIYDNEIEQAKELLTKKYKAASAVIAGVILETSIRKLCDSNGLEHGKLDRMNADLLKAGVYNKLQSKRITALADIRNSAAHGKNTEYTHEDVELMIREVESFLLNHLK